MRHEISIAYVLVLLVSQSCQAQAPAEVWFRNNTDTTVTIRCFSKRLELAGFSHQVKPRESVGTTNLASGDRVIGAWSTD